MKTLSTLALLTALVVGSSASANEFMQDLDFYRGGAMCGTCPRTDCCEPTCMPRPHCTDCNRKYETVCYTECCQQHTVCCPKIQGIFETMGRSVGFGW